MLGSEGVGIAHIARTPSVVGGRSWQLVKENLAHLVDSGWCDKLGPESSHLGTVKL